jgi:hypothetical protein
VRQHRPRANRRHHREVPLRGALRFGLGRLRRWPGRPAAQELSAYALHMPSRQGKTKPTTQKQAASTGTCTFSPERALLAHPVGGGVNATHHCCRARPGALGAPAAPLARLGGRARAAAPSAAAAALGSGGGGVAAPAPATPGRPATPAAAAPALGLGRTALGVPQGQLVSAPCLVACTHGDSIRVLG